MPLSLKSHLKKFVHKGQITQEEYDALIKKLDGHDKEIRNKVIDEFAEKISLEISESIIWGMVVTAHRDGNCSETSDEIVDYVIDTAKSVAQLLKEET